MRISDWSSDVCSSDLESGRREFIEPGECEPERETDRGGDQEPARDPFRCIDRRPELRDALRQRPHRAAYRTPARSTLRRLRSRSEEHTSELQSLMRISYAVFCLKKKKQTPHPINTNTLLQDI